MDIATIAGLIAAGVLMCAAILQNGSLLAFFDLPSVLLVLFGTVAIMFVGYPAGTVKNAFKVVMHAMRNTPRSPEQVLQLMREMSSRARREGVLVLEDMANDQEDAFLKKGIQMVVDGHDPSAIEEVLYNEVDKITERHKEGSGFFEDLGAFAPAMGMIGTLIGLVQMLGKLDDPSAIGPAMAVALLTTLYGAVIANVFALPVARKLKLRSGEEVAEKLLIVQGLLSILAGESPRFLVDRLNAQLPPTERLSEAG
jgi:chemotaxis protein MotA